MDIVKKVIAFFDDKKYIIVSLIFLLVFFMINFFDMKYKFNASMLSGRNYYFCFTFLAIVFCILIYVLVKRNKYIDDNNIPRVFVLTTLIFGICFCFLSPLFTGSDEHNHYYRIYEITEGVLVTPTNKYVGGKLPKSLKETFLVASGENTKIKYRDIKKMKEIKFEKNSKSQYGKVASEQYSNTALYSPIQYLPQVVGFSVGKLFNLSPYVIGMLGRLFNLIVYVILGYFALKLIPTSKIFYLLILLSPNLLQCATTLSADAFTNVIFLLLIAVIFNKIYTKQIINFKGKVLLFALSIIISLCKIVYLPAVFLLLLLDKNIFKNGKRGKYLYIGVTIFASVIVGFLWMGCTDGIFAIAYDKTALQKEFILSNIIEYMIIFIRTMVNNFVQYVECLFVGTTMYHSQLKMPSLISIIYVIIVFLALFKSKDRSALNNISKLGIVLVAIIIVGLISTAIYIQCTAQFIAISNPVIGGIQGRYFIPVILLLPYILVPIKKRTKINNVVLYGCALLINVVTYFYMFAQFSV